MSAFLSNEDIEIEITVIEELELKIAPSGSIPCDDES